MVCFLTSSAYCEEYQLLNPKNDFVKNLKKYWNKESNVLYIASFHDEFAITDEYSKGHKQAFIDSGFKIKNFYVLDHRNVSVFEKYFNDADVIILCGGHCPTEMKFFEELKLRDYLKNYNGIIIATSAGSMNAACIVYAQPELEGETLDSYVKYFNGLCLTNINILPHYNEYKDHVLDGKRVFEDITYEDSVNNYFYCFPDGSYLLIENGIQTIYGECHLINNRNIKQICSDNELLIVK